jgi:hypothetical protein
MKWKMSILQSIYNYLFYNPKINETMNNILYLSKYYIYQIKTSYLYQKIISNYYGLSIAEKSHQTLKISYIYEGNQYSVYIPFEKKYIHKMRNQNVILYYDSHHQDLEQQPGVPYLITPKHIGAKWAKIHTIQGEQKINEKEPIPIQ